MKKLLVGLFIFVSLTIGVEAHASWVSDSVMRDILQLRSKLGSYVAGYNESGSGASISANNDTTPTTDLTPRISYWYGKVNQHVDIASGTWQTDRDGTSGGQLDKLTYCQKFYPNTTSVVSYKAETINTWKDAGNLNNYVGDSKMSYKCVSDTPVTPVTTTNLRVSKSPEDPMVNRVAVSSTYVTSDVLIAAIQLRNNNSSSVSLSKFGIKIDKVMAKGSLSNMVNKLNIKNNSNQLASITNISNDGVYIFNLSLPFQIKGNSFETFFIYADIKNINNFTSGDSLTVSFNNILATDQNGNTIGSDGNTYGSTQTFYLDNVTPAITSTITVLSPNGGEVYQAGDKMTIRWKTMNAYNPNTLVAVMDDRIPDWQTLSLFGSSPALDYAKYVSASGNGGNTEYTYEYTFTIPSTFNDSLPSQYRNIYGGKHYKILTNMALPGLTTSEDYSDNTFTINSSSVDNGCSTGQRCSNIPAVKISASNGSQTSDSSINLKIGDTLTISGTPQNLQGLSYYTGNGKPTSGYYNMAYFFDQNFSNNNYCGNNEPTVNGPWIMTCTAKVTGSSSFYIEIYTNGQTYKSNTVNVVIGSSATTPSITVLSPNGGETFVRGEKNKISWNGGKNKVQVGIAYPDFKIQNLGTDMGIQAWIELNGKPNSSIFWDGISLKDLNGEKSYFNPGEGNYKIILISEDKNGNYCIPSINDGGCNYDLSDNSFVIKFPSVENGCSNGEVYSSTTGQVCPSKEYYMTLIQPEAGKTLIAGEIYNVKWESNIPSYAYLTIKIKDNNSNLIREIKTKNDGQEMVRIPYGTFPGTYKVEISNGSAERTIIYANAIFTVTSNLNTGCSNGEVYSSTNGQLCLGVDRGCNGTNFSSTTGQRCPASTITNDDGCNGTRYSTTTGQYCSNYTGYDSENPGSGSNFENNSTPIRRTLKPGLVGNDVRTLQQFLGITADGVFGRGTAQKVKNWQSQNGLNPDGSFGFLSRQKANLVQ